MESHAQRALRKELLIDLFAERFEKVHSNFGKVLMIKVVTT